MLRKIKLVRLYRTESGREPFVKWLGSLKDKVARAHVLNRVHRLSLGQYGDHKSLGGGIFELRIHYRPGYRVYFSEHGPGWVIVLFGGNKSSQKRDIAQAIKYWNHYKERYHVTWH